MKRTKPELLEEKENGSTGFVGAPTVTEPIKDGFYPPTSEFSSNEGAGRLDAAASQQPIIRRSGLMAPPPLSRT